MHRTEQIICISLDDGLVLPLTAYADGTAPSAMFAAGDQPLIFGNTEVISVFEELVRARRRGFTTACGKFINPTMPLFTKELT